MAQTKSTRSTKSKKKTKTSTPQEVIERETPPTVHDAQSDDSLQNLVDECKAELQNDRKLDIMQEFAVNFGRLADVISHHSEKINNMENFLSRFENLFLLFQKRLEASFDEKLSKFERSLETTISNQTKKINEITHITQEYLKEDKNKQNLDQCQENSELMSTLKSMKEATEAFKNKEKEEVLKKEAQRFKQKHIDGWNEALNQRKKRYWSHIMNKNKADLYTRWQKTTPDFIPKKYRPKHVPSDPVEVKSIKINDAKKQMMSNIEEMRIYAGVHQEKFMEIDGQMAEEIDQMPLIKQDIKTKMKELWHEEAEINQQKSIQIWYSKEKFLLKKRHEELQLGVEKCQFSEITWQEILKHRSLKRKRIKLRAVNPTESNRFQDLQHLDTF